VIAEPVDLELMANRFSRLIKDLLQGKVQRTSFERWEVQLLVDLDSCRLSRSRRDEALRRYQRAVVHQLERGEVPPVRFCDFARQRPRKPAAELPLETGQDPPALNT
jgi:hypothetical protein